MNYPSAHTIARYQRLARSFGSWSESIDKLTDQVTAHKAHCKAAANRVDQAFKDLGK